MSIIKNVLFNGKQKDQNNFRHRQFTLKVRILQTAENQKKQFDVEYLIIYEICIYLFFIVTGDLFDPPQPWAL